MQDIGILCRGKSLQKLPKIINHFKDCFIINDWRLESFVFEDHLKKKNIIHFLNADRRSYLGPKIYKRLGITEGIISWTKIHEEPGKGKGSRGKSAVKAAMNKYSKFLKMSYLPDEYYDICNRLNSAGILSILYASEELQPKHIWIAGLDFYSCDYLMRRRGTYRPLDTDKMRIDFIHIVKRYPKIKYHVATYYKKMPTKLKNLEVL